MSKACFVQKKIADGRTDRQTDIEIQGYLLLPEI